MALHLKLAPQPSQLTAEERSERSHTAAKRSSLTSFLAAWALFSAIGMLWAIATPLGGSPDEPSHIVKAAAVVRGQWTGITGPVPVDRTQPGAPTVVNLPEPYSTLGAVAGCFAFDSNKTADCVNDIFGGDPDKIVAATTYAGRYPPLYYLAAGWPSLILEGSTAIYAMRISSAVLCGALFALGVMLLAGSRSPRIALLGAAVATTPMVPFLSGTVNPNGLEIASAFAAWCAALLVVLDRDAEQIRRRLIILGASVAVLVNVRASSPMFVFLIVVVALALASRADLRELVRSRVLIPVVAMCAVASVVAFAWIIREDALGGTSRLYPEYSGDDNWLFERTVLGQSGNYLRQMVGWFGWLDTPAPLLTLVLWISILSALVVLALAVTTSVRRITVLALMLSAVAFLPLALQQPSAADNGNIWQGRYLLPLAIGVPLLSSLIVANERAELFSILRIDRLAAVVLPVAHVAAFYWTLRRYSVGDIGDIVPGLATPWSPPGGLFPLVFLYLVATAGGSVLLMRSRDGSEIRTCDDATSPALGGSMTIATADSGARECS